MELLLRFLKKGGKIHVTSTLTKVIFNVNIISPKDTGNKNFF